MSKGDAIRFGLGAVKNVGQNAVEAIIKARERELGSFRSIYQFCEHADMSGDQSPRDGEPGQAPARWIRCRVRGANCCSRSMARSKPALALGVTGCRGREVCSDGMHGRRIPEPTLPKANDWTLREKLQGEKELLGFYVTGHPLDSYEDKICELATHDSTQSRRSRKGRRSRAVRGDHGRFSGGAIAKASRGRHS